jgi:hypothetical protein
MEGKASMEGNVLKKLLESIAIYKEDNHVLKSSVMPILNVSIYFFIRFSNKMGELGKHNK